MTFKEILIGIFISLIVGIVTYITCRVFINIITLIYSAQSEYTRLTEWHDPKKELPKTDVEVLCMVDRQFNTYEVCRYDNDGWWVKAPIQQGGWCGADCKILGWREIHEPFQNKT